MMTYTTRLSQPDSKIHEANMGPIWGRQDPGGPLAGPMNFAIWVPSKWIIVFETTNHKQYINHVY